MGGTILNIPYGPIGTRDERRVLARGVAHFNKQGVPIRLNGTLQDITQITELRKKTEASEHNLRNIILQSPVGMAMLKGPSFIVDIANEPMLELWGKTSADVTGKPLANGIPDAKDVGLFEDLLQNVFLTGERYVTLERKVKLMKFNKPEYKYLNLVYQALREDDTTILGVIVTANDVTDQVILRQQLEQKQEILRSLVLNSPFGICVLDGPTRINELANDKFFTITGKTHEELIGRYHWETYPNSRVRFESALTNVLEKGISFSQDETEVVFCKDGIEKRVFVNFVYEPIKSVSGEVLKVVVWLVEHTSRVEARQKFEKLPADQASQLNELRKTYNQN